MFPAHSNNYCVTLWIQLFSAGDPVTFSELLEHGLDRVASLRNGISDDPKRFISSTPKIFFRQKNQIENIAFCTINLVWFLRSHSRTDFKIIFLVGFCSRLNYSEVCTSKNSRIWWNSRISNQVFTPARASARTPVPAPSPQLQASVFLAESNPQPHMYFSFHY